MFKTTQNIGISIVSFFLILFLTVSCNKAKTEDLTAALALADTGPIYGDSCELAPTQNVTLTQINKNYTYLKVSNVPDGKYIKIKTTVTLAGMDPSLTQISSQGALMPATHTENTLVDGLAYASYANQNTSVDTQVFSEAGSYYYTCYACFEGPCSRDLTISMIYY